MAISAATAATMTKIVSRPLMDFAAAGAGAAMGRAVVAGAAAAARGAGAAAAGAAARGAGAGGAPGAGIWADGPPGGNVGNLIVGAADGFGGRLIRTVSFFGWTLPVSFFGGTAPAGGVGMLSAICICNSRYAPPPTCQTLIPKKCPVHTRIRTSNLNRAEIQKSGPYPACNAHGVKITSRLGWKQGGREIPIKLNQIGSS